MVFRILRGSLRLHEESKKVFSAELLDGFVINDLFESKHLGFGVYGSLLQSMNKANVNECISILKDEQIIKQQGFYQGKELYKISDELHDFLMDCVMVLQELIRLIESSWNYRKYRRKEIRWYSEFFGNQKALDMINIKDNIEAKERKEKQKEIERSINFLRINTKELDKDEYKDIKSKYPFLWDTVMKIVKPTFLKKWKITIKFRKS